METDFYKKYFEKFIASTDEKEIFAREICEDVHRLKIKSKKY